MAIRNLKTPHLDRLAGESVELTRFHVSPVCSPTRSSLLTGRYNYRTGVVDTFLGRSTMAADETTLAEMLAAAGYRTGHFRQMAPGRQLPLAADRSGISRVAGASRRRHRPAGRSAGQSLLRSRRWCTTAATRKRTAIAATCSPMRRFVSSTRIAASRSSFTWPSTARTRRWKCPTSTISRYQGLGLDDDTAKVYGMVANIDDNLGRLFARPCGAGGLDRTIRSSCFLPTTARNSGGTTASERSEGLGPRRGNSCSLPGFAGRANARRAEDRPTGGAHRPGADAARRLRRDRPPDVKFDGVSLRPLLVGQRRTDGRLALALLVLSMAPRRRAPEAFAPARCGDRATSWCSRRAARAGSFSPAWELFDMQADPGENDEPDRHQPDIVAEMKAAYEAWFADVSSHARLPRAADHRGQRAREPCDADAAGLARPGAGWTEDERGGWEIDAGGGGHLST